MAINLFQIAQQDQALSYLGQIFGYVGNLLPVENPNIIVGPILFKTLNTLALTVGAFVIVYVTVVGLLKTAEEGEFLGRKWDKLWVPIRTVLGIAALFPTSTGYSVIQIVIMWVVLQGIGAADALWTKVLQYVTKTGSVYATVNSTSLPLTLIQPRTKDLFRGLMCQASAKASYSNISTEETGGSDPIKYYCGQPNQTDKFCTRSDAEMLNPLKGEQVSGNVYSMGPTLGKCGSLTLCTVANYCLPPPMTDANGRVMKDANGNPIPDTRPESVKKALDSDACLACKAQRAAMGTIVPTLGAIASKLVAIDNQYAQFYEYPVDPTNAPDWVKNYCSATGIPADQCCKIPPNTAGAAQTQCSKYFPSDKGSSYADTSSSTTTPINAVNSATDFYLQYPLGAYLNGSDFINAAIGEYQAALVGAVAENRIRQSQNITLSGWQAAAQKYGWILAGAFYYQLAGENQSGQDAVNIPFDVSSPDKGYIAQGYRSNYNAVGDLLASMVAANNSSAGFGNALGASDPIALALDSSAGSLLESWKNSLTNNSCSGMKCNMAGDVRSVNPLISIATFGYQMMITGQVLFLVITVLVGVYVGVTTINPMVLGTGLTMNPLGEAFKAMITLVGPFFVLLIGALYSIGALLGIYVPLIPYMIFTLGAIGWVIATIEAMVAGPIIALGILSPGGQHDILGRAEPALMFIFNLFLRPSLMIIGMIMSMFLSIVVIKLVNSGFLAATSQIITHPMLFEQILFIAAYTSFIVTVLNKAFSLIYVIPERVLTYINGPSVSYGESQDLGASKGAVEGAASSTTGESKASGAAVKSQVHKQAKVEAEGKGQKGTLKRKK